MSEFWDERYGPEEYFYGKEPNGFFKSCIDNGKPGKILLPGDGEGRNAVYAARKGWKVFAFDQSKMGRKKALVLAKEHDVSIRYDVCGMAEYNIEENNFDMISLIYIHLYEEERKLFHHAFAKGLKPGGLLVMEVFSKKQFGNSSGGPRDIELLYDIDDLKDDFQTLEILQAENLSVYHDESYAHTGDAEIIRFIGRKK